MWVILLLVASVICESPLRPLPDKETPKKCPPNEHYERCPKRCPATDGCSLLWSKKKCEPEEGCNLPPVCRCNPGLYRNSKGKCVPGRECSNPVIPEPLKCRVNETEFECKEVCPPRSCAISYTSYICDQPIICERGCDCKENYLRNSTGTCVFNEDCTGPPEVPPNIPKPPKKCPANEYMETCPKKCPGTDGCSLLWSKIKCEPEEGCNLPPVCRCKPGLFRNSKGKCVTGTECTNPVTPEPPLKCRANETEVECKTVCPPRSCAISYTSYNCGDAVPKICERGCDCKKNYLRNSTGTCVFKEDCTGPPEVPPSIVCGYNEKPVDCVRTCPPEDCLALYLNYLCAYKEPNDCDRGCMCLDGHLRNSSGFCIPIKECPPAPWVILDPLEPTCGVNETYVKCKQKCPPQKCDISYTTYDCTRVKPSCEPGCDCKENYLRNEAGDCVLNNDCPPPPPSDDETTTTTPAPSVNITCPANEVKAMCKRLCPPQSCDAKYAIYECNIPLPCIPGCNCKENFYRNKDGVCISSAQCPPPPWKTTTTPVPPVTRKPPNIHPPRPPPCRAVASAHASTTGSGSSTSSSSASCTPVKPLPPKCPKNEIRVNCKVECPLNYCPKDDRRGLLICDPPHPCPSGCVCQVGFRRVSSKNTTCIPSENCPPVKCTGPNEKWNPCPRPCFSERCKDVGKPPIICNTLIKDCQPQCVCKEGHYRNDSNICVPEKQCTPVPTTPRPTTTTESPVQQCNANETYAPCAFDCPTIFCARTEYDSLIACSPPYPCRGGCICKETNHRRRSSKDRTCIPIEECPPVTCSGKNQKWDVCPGPCLAESCDDADKPKPICLEKRRYCSPKCVCAKGYYRNKSNICVPASECPKPTTTEPPTTTIAPIEETCPAGERWAQCAFDCPTDFCPRSESDTMVACGLPYNCSGGCVCQDFNHRRRSVENRTCISILECPPITCSNPNEVYNPCVTNCFAQTCEEALNPKPCTREVKYCQPKCVCADGYYRDKNNVCVPIAKCSKPECTGNQTIVYCPRFKCPHQFCPTTEKPRPIACKPPRDCGDGCGCNVPYRYRSSTDFSCVLAEDCPKVKCTKQYEEWNPCPSLCLDESCDKANAPPSICEDTGHDCRPQCTCKKGYFRNDSGDCVPKEQCFEGKCPTGETWLSCAFDCPTNFCPESESDTMVACDAPFNCLGGCVCQDFNFRRRSLENRTCISIFQCPLITCSNPNEVYNPCVTDCLAQTCEEAAYPKPCTKEMKYCQAKCVCADGYYRDENYACVPVSECPKTPTTETPIITTVSPPAEPCGVNETTVDCTFKCPHHFCPANDEGVIYACKPPRDCPSGCGCKLGYKYKSYDNLTCVLAEDCPPVECTRQNEVWDPCTSGCLDESCANADNPPVVCNELVHNCEPKCVCKKGFYRNDSGICVSKTECQQCKANERYVRCKAGCPTDTCPTDDSRAIIACDPPYPCPGGCVCKLNYKYRSYNDQTCILASKCPPVNCTRQNEIWSPCPTPCLTESCDSAFHPTKVCNYLVQNCQPRCICKKGFFRNHEDICVPAKKCPRKLQPVGTDV